ncbi:MerR family transcriptional regulator [Melghirimyces algeriensis]|uniref:Transcriptional regulator, MerR family n=1 Tax=Melghirimyces algeriensis TaxID=910412 RepID=A0A521CCX6_9BACL|nr:MerR family transcriptional regulator [Melghirimyces algeriensis]SMO57272.1 transcriptional regulator, MerR family [Melghirimyces algeriensis]
MRIGELSKKTGVSVRSLRYYDKQNLLHAKRLENGYRSFDESSVERVRLIQLYLGLGLNSKQIEQILRCKDHHQVPEEDDLCEELLDLYRNRLREVDDQLHLLLDVKKRLQESIYSIEERIKEYEDSQ